MEKQDQKVTILAVDGNTVAFETLMRKYYQPLRKFLASYKLDDQEKSDLLQECFIRAYKNIGKLQPPYNFKSWLFKICGNMAKNNYSRRKIHSSLENKDFLTKTSSEDEIPEKDKLNFLIMAIDNLSPALKKTARYYFLHNHTINIITHKLNVPAGTIKRRLFDAKELIQKEYAKMKKQEAVPQLAPVVTITVRDNADLKIKTDNISMLFGNFGREPEVGACSMGRNFEYPGGLLDTVHVYRLTRKVNFLEKELYEVTEIKQKNEKPFSQPVTIYHTLKDNGYEIAFCSMTDKEGIPVIDEFNSEMKAEILRPGILADGRIVEAVSLTIDNNCFENCLRTTSLIKKGNQKHHAIKDLYDLVVEFYFTEDGRTILVRVYEFVENNAKEEVYLVNNQSRFIENREYRLRYEEICEVIKENLNS